MRSGRCSRLAGLILFALSGSVLAFTPGPYNGRINSAVSNVVADKLKGAGYVETDARFQRTMNAIMKSGGKAMGTGATGRAIGFLFRRVTPIGLVLSLASDMTQTNMDQDQVQLAGAALNQTVVNDPSSGVVAGGAYWACSGAKGGDPQSVAWQCFTVGLPWETWTFAPYNTGAWTSIRQIYQGSRWHPSFCSAGGCQVNTVYADKTLSGAPITCGKGSYINSTNQCVPYTYTVHNAPAYAPTPKTVEQAAADVSPETAAKPLADTAVAQLADDWWEKAQSEDQDVLPKPSPITPADVARTKSPTAPPVIGDWWSPAAPPSETERVPLPTPGTSTPDTTEKPDPATPGQGTQVDLGSDPNTPAPNLEATPTIQSIIGPITSLMPDLRNINVADQAGTCPQPSFTVFNRAYTVSSHCDLINNNRAVIEAAMMAVWTILAMFIVLRA